MQFPGELALPKTAPFFSIYVFNFVRSLDKSRAPKRVIFLISGGVFGPLILEIIRSFRLWYICKLYTRWRAREF